MSRAGHRARPVVCFVADARNPLVHNWLADTVSRGYEVHLASIDPPAQRTDGVVEHQLLPTPWAAMLPRSLRYAAALPALRRRLRRIDPDIVHAHYAWGYGLAAAAAGRHGGLIVSVWGTDILVSAGRTRLHTAAMRWMLGRATTVCATSQHLAQQTTRYTDGPVFVTPFGVDCDRFTPRAAAAPAGVVTIGMVKRLNDNSGVSALLEAYARARRRFPGGTRLVIAGWAPDDRWTRRARQLGIDGSTTFLGPLPFDAVPQTFREMDVVVQPSLETEGFGVAVLEAQACGVPVIASDLGGLPEVVDEGVTGLLVPAGDSEALSEALVGLVADRDRRARMGGAAREFVLDRYSQQLCGRTMDDVYRHTLGGDGTPGTRGPGAGRGAGWGAG